MIKDHSTARQTAWATIDQGLRQYMLQVYNYMAVGLGLTGFVAFAVAHSPAMIAAIFGTPLYWFVLLAPVGIVFYLSSRIEHMSFSTAQLVFWIYAGLMGMSLSSVFLAYTGESIARVFFITAATFGSMSLYGYTTKKDLTGIGSFLMMGLFGLVIAMLVNMFMRSTALDFVLSALGVLIFTGLTAYDTQIIRGSYYSGDHTEVSSKKAIMGALRLYLDFVNLFLMLLRFLGDRR